MENVLSMTPANFITVWLMVALLGGMIYLALRFFNNSVSEKSNA